jgi:hypothetical protein
MIKDLQLKIYVVFNDENKFYLKIEDYLNRALPRLAWCVRFLFRKFYDFCVNSKF